MMKIDKTEDELLELMRLVGGFISGVSEEEWDKITKMVIAHHLLEELLDDGVDNGDQE